MPAGNSNNLPVIGPDLKQAGNAHEERCPVCPGRLRPVFSQRQYRYRLAEPGEYVNALVPVLFGKVDPGMPRNASPSPAEKPYRPVRVTLAALAGRIIALVGDPG